MNDPEKVVDALFAALFAGMTEEALARCADDGEWHTLTPAFGWHGSYPIETYVREFAPKANLEMRDIRVESAERDVVDSLLVLRLRTSWTARDGAREIGAGVMITRVADGKVTDIWSISADPTRPF